MTKIATASLKAPNRKAAPIAALPTNQAQDVAEAFDDFMRAFEAFKGANDERLKELESQVGADPITASKVETINAAVDEQKRVLEALVEKAARPHLGGGSRTTKSNFVHKSAFDRYVRSGQETGLRDLEAKSMSYGSGPDGGYLVPPEMEAEVGSRLAVLSPVRALADVRQVTGAVLKKPFAVSGPAVGWVGETDARPETNAGQLAELQFPTMELYAMPAATASLLEDSAIDIDTWIAGEIETAFAEQESAAFINGDGAKKPRGLMNYTSVAEGSWTWGNIGHVRTGVAGDFGTGDAGAGTLIDTIYALKAGYRQNAAWLMNRKTQAAVRKLKDADGNYIWQPPSAVGEKALLMGFAVSEAEDMPDIDTDANAIAFGDFKRGYLVVDRAGISVLRDPYSAKPYVLFYTTKRVGGGVQDFDAIKFVQFSA
ncbi:MAG: phage major capsid protein [Pseudomonadota bacterium]